jgi:hypothetical protein
VEEKLSGRLQWINDLMERRAISLKQIAMSERKDERHIRYLAQLAFVSGTLFNTQGREQGLFGDI